MNSSHSAERAAARLQEMENVGDVFGFATRTCLDFPTAGLDGVPLTDLIEAVGKVIGKVAPSELFVPFDGDVHSDHRIVHDAVIAATKWFRSPSIRRLLAYETLSETDAAVSTSPPFQPNHFVDITTWLEGKIEAMNIYEGETGKFPFPRSAKAIRALAMTRGAACGAKAAEAFMLLRQIES